MRHHLWRHRVQGPCTEPVALCQALNDQIPEELSSHGLEAVAKSRLREPSFQYLCGIQKRQQEEKWLHSCYGLLPAYEEAFHHHNLLASLGASEEGGLFSMIGDGERLDVLLQASEIQLKPRTPRLQEQWSSLFDLFHQEQLFRESSVLQLGLTPADALPLPALGALGLGSAAFARVYAPRWALRALRSLQSFLGPGEEERFRLGIFRFGCFLVFVDLF